MSAGAVSLETIECVKKKILELNTSSANKKSILDFSDSCFAEGLSKRRVLKYLYILRNIARYFSLGFKEAKKSDVEKYVNTLELSDYSEWTKHDYKVTLKKFFRWLRDNDEYPPEVKWIRSTFKKNRTRLPEEILTPDEIQKLVVAASTNRDKAFISSLYESGCRITELLSLQIKQINRHPNGFQITVHGEKGNRRVLLLASYPYLTAWLNDHPMRQSKNSPLWPTGKDSTKQLSYGRISDILKIAARRAGIQKAVNPHNFRHSRATHLAKHLTEAQLKEYFGWVQGSDMASTYVHLSGRDIDSALLKLHNIPVSKEDEAEESFSLRKCSRCEIHNPPSNKFCSRCGNVLSDSGEIDLIKSSCDRSDLDRIMDSLARDEKFLSAIREAVKRMVDAERHRQDNS